MTRIEMMYVPAPHVSRWVGMWDNAYFEHGWLPHDAVTTLADALESRGIDLARPFTMQIDTTAHFIRAEQPPVSKEAPDMEREGVT